MRRLAALAVLGLALPLAGCPAADASHDKQIADLRADLQRSDKEVAKQKEQIAALERRLNGLADDVAAVRKSASDAVTEAATKADAAAHAALADGTGQAGSSSGAKLANEAAMKAFFESDAGKKQFAATMKSIQDQQAREQTLRMMEDQLARFAKDQNLTDDQTKRMQDLLARVAPKFQEITQAWRDIYSGSTPPEERDQARQNAIAQGTELKSSTDGEVKGILSQTQFDAYQKQFGQGIGGMGGFRGGPGGGRRPGGGGNGN